MSFEIIESSPVANEAAKKGFQFNRKVDIDYFQLNIGQSFKIPVGTYALPTLKMNAKRFMEKHPDIALRVIHHKELNVYEVARIRPAVATGVNVGNTNELE